MRQERDEDMNEKGAWKRRHEVDKETVLDNSFAHSDVEHHYEQIDIV